MRSFHFVKNYMIMNWSESEGKGVEDSEKSFPTKYNLKFLV